MMRNRHGFTLVELLIVMSILSVVFLITASLLETSQRTWNRTRTLAEQYREPRIAFETITRRLSDSKLHTYWDYLYDDGLPIRYVKTSGMHFVTGKATTLAGRGSEDETKFPTHAVFFLGPFGDSDDSQIVGMEALLNAWGYYIEFNSDFDWAPAFTRESRVPRYRYRLMEFRQPSEQLEVYNTDTPEDRKWFGQHLKPGNLNVVAENVIALIVQPMDSREEISPLAPDYSYDSRGFNAEVAPESQQESHHELPPLVNFTMVVIDEGSADKIQGDSETPPKDLDYRKAAPFKKAADYEKDIAALEAFLSKKKVEYRVFQSIVPIRNARFTSGRKRPAAGE